MAGDFVGKAKTYAVPVVLFSLAMLYQLILLPRAFPPSRYDALGIKTYSSIEEVQEAYVNLESKWNSGLEVPSSYSHRIYQGCQQYAGEKFYNIELPLLNADAFDTGDYAFNVITSKEFQSMFQDSKPWLLQVYSSSSNRSTQFANFWKKIVALLNGVANIGMVELGEIQIAAYLAERKPMGQFFFKNAFLQWLLSHQGVKLQTVLSGERATPIIRQAAKDYWNYATFACVLWSEEELSVWWTAFGVESAPAVVFLKDPGSMNDSWFLDVLEENKQQELRQLRSLTSEGLGCNARGYSRAGHDTLTWYCAIFAGRLSPDLDSMRETMRRVQETLSKSSKLNAASVALKSKRLTLSWLDGEMQNNYCFFYLNTESSIETCGPRRVPTDVPRLFIIRYERNATEDTFKVQNKAKSIWEFHQQEVDPAARLSVTFNGSAEVSQIIQWISNIIKDGDSRKLPFYASTILFL
ncbi:FKBP-like peptidyl-prolyl cis-trans isomerase family protein isoform 1 [Hibiscus syriacus]|uniref:FKBP-like peptidyl-prolyl cis-trans isomerase family protein isoform 1 n=1 Tax=Hibiscus syriacus TaxID=106335 RepID=A0A6A2XBD4_HIBSY|nr:FKBP-like peptidyl-prolyl cis-trans isomerase family protein isoform 1 [Hibiscus syriacus]